MNYRAWVAYAAAVGVILAAGQASAATFTVNASDDLYNIGPNTYDGGAPVAINVAGLSSIVFSVSTGQTATVNGGNYNDADGLGSVSGEFNTGGNGISGITTPTAGFLAGAFAGATIGTIPAALDVTASGTSFADLSPKLQQAFFIGDGLTGDGVGTTQTFYVPTGATTLYLGLADACGYNGSPSCFGDNFGSFSVTTTGVGAIGAVPEPATWAMLLMGLAGIGAALRSNGQRRAIRLA
jgi:hypothetical protein